jgi:hypothetical protein
VEILDIVAAVNNAESRVLDASLTKTEYEQAIPVMLLDELTKIGVSADEAREALIHHIEETEEMEYFEVLSLLEYCLSL